MILSRRNFVGAAPLLAVPAFAVAQSPRAQQARALSPVWAQLASEHRAIIADIGRRPFWSRTAALLRLQVVLARADNLDDAIRSATRRNPAATEQYVARYVAIQDEATALLTHTRYRASPTIRPSLAEAESALAVLMRDGVVKAWAEALPLFQAEEPAPIIQRIGLYQSQECLDLRSLLYTTRVATAYLCIAAAFEPFLIPSCAASTGWLAILEWRYYSQCEQP